MAILTEQDPEIRDSTVYWFFLLENALEHGDYDLAAQADAELQRLGVRVRHTHRRGREEAQSAS
jgi:hypothetical protein